MKKLILFSILTYLISLMSLSQEYGWKDISDNIPEFPPYANPRILTDIYFINDNEGWITTLTNQQDSSFILHTTDGGETFEMQKTQFGCQATHMLNENEGYAGGYQGRVYRTTDGGENWDAIGSMGTTLIDISFPPSGDTGYACGGILYGVIYSITSSGIIQMDEPIVEGYSSISFPINSSYGKVCGGSPILTFANGIWGGAPNSYPSGGYNAIYMVDNQSGWAVGDQGIIIHTSDGINWFEQANPDPLSRTFFDLYFLNNQDGWAIGRSGQIIHTTDGGNNWTLQYDGNPQDDDFIAVFFTSPTNGFVSGHGNKLMKYTEVSGIGDKITPVVFEIFPNPSKDKIQIECSELKKESGKIEILSMEGNELLEKQVAKGNKNIELDLNYLETGMYLCKITIDKRSSTKKIIKK